MSRAYSVLLARGSAVVAAPVTVYTVPAGFRTVVKHIEVSALSAVPATLYVRLASPATIMTFVPVTVLATSARWQGMLVMNAGDVLQVTAVTNSLVYYISGYELTVP